MTYYLLSLPEEGMRAELMLRTPLTRNDCRWPLWPVYPIACRFAKNRYTVPQLSHQSDNKSTWSAPEFRSVALPSDARDDPMAPISEDHRWTQNENEQKRKAITCLFLPPAIVYNVVVPFVAVCCKRIDSFTRTLYACGRYRIHVTHTCA